MSIHVQPSARTQVPEGFRKCPDCKMVEPQDQVPGVGSRRYRCRACSAIFNRIHRFPAEFKARISFSYPVVFHAPDRFLSPCPATLFHKHLCFVIADIGLGANFWMPQLHLYDRGLDQALHMLTH